MQTQARVSTHIFCGLSFAFLQKWDHILYTIFQPDFFSEAIMNILVLVVLPHPFKQPHIVHSMSCPLCQRKHQCSVAFPSQVSVLNTPEMNRGDNFLHNFLPPPPAKIQVS